MEAVLARLGDMALVGLDATPQGRPVYAKLGFAEAGTFLRMGTDGGSREAADGSAAPLGAGDLEAVLRLDREVFGADRGDVLRWALAQAPAWCVRDGDRVTAYCFGRVGQHSRHVGPVVASSVESARSRPHRGAQPCRRPRDPGRQRRPGRLDGGARRAGLPRAAAAHPHVPRAAAARPAVPSGSSRSSARSSASGQLAQRPRHVRLVGVEAQRFAGSAAAAPRRSPSASRVSAEAVAAPCVDARPRGQRALEEGQRLGRAAARGQRARQVQQRLARSRLALHGLAEERDAPRRRGPARIRTTPSFVMAPASAGSTSRMRP